MERKKCEPCGRFVDYVKFYTYGKQNYAKYWGKDYEFLCNDCEKIALSKVNLDKYEEVI